MTPEDRSTLKEIEEEVDRIQAEFIKLIKDAAAQGIKIAALRSGPSLFNLNRGLCVCRCLAEEIKSNEDRERVIARIKRIDTAVFSAIQYKEPKHLNYPHDL